ncbi:MAG TPA: CYCXC family (seleno)protein [Pyrinomonadaceae bacterium]|jgi:hypothetical protein|nr:CYCXC family (seleno)protein [Pyrinomonadaceae bacterium]
MKSNVFVTAVLLSVFVAACADNRSSSDAPRAAAEQRPAQSHASSSSQPASSQSSAPVADAHGHEGHGHEKGRVPAFETDAASLKSLSPTLAPQMFSGKQQEAYRAVKEIPQTIAQLPCYCHCDRGFGHKSLHSCFVDDHAAHCAVCVDEALLAYRLQKQEKLTPARIRERIVAHYAAQE